MALQSQVWSPATPIPMAESSLYRQRLEVIAEKRRLQEEIRVARGELEEEKLRVERLKRKSLRERWLMDGAEVPEGLEDATLQDSQSPEGQAQARIRNLEDSLFTLQSQLQLLQSASTGAQHKPSGRFTWRRQGHRPLSQPTVEVDTAGQTDLNKRASLPAEPVDTFLESLSEPRDEAVGVLLVPRRVPGAPGASSEANGPCPRPSTPPEQEQNQGVTVSEAGVCEAKGGAVVKVVWEGLRATEDCARGATGPELEAKVEEMVLEAIGDRLEANRPELPSWVKEDRGVVEVVWEGVGGTEGSDSEAAREAGRSPQTSSPRLQERLEGGASGEEAPRSSPDGFRQGGSGGEEGSFIWVEHVTLSEEWEELLVEGLEGPRARGIMERGDESPLGLERGGGEETWATERRQAEELVGTGKKGSAEKAGTEWEGVELSLDVEREGREEAMKLERRGGEGKVETQREGFEEARAPGEPLSAESKGTEGPLRAERGTGEEPLGAEQSGGEEKLEAGKEVEEPSGGESNAVEGPLRAEKERGEEKLGLEKEIEEPLVVEEKGDEEKLEVTEEPLMTERTEGEGSLTVERMGDKKALDAEKKDEDSLKKEATGGEEPLEGKKTQEMKEDVSPEEQSKSERGNGCQAEEASEASTPVEATEGLRPEEGGPQQPQEKQEGSLEEEAVKLQTPAEGQDPSGDTTPLLAETPAPEQPTECQPLLVEGPRANPSTHPVPTYAPARQPEPSAPPEGEEASGPKQKTCQCCVVM